MDFSQFKDYSIGDVDALFKKIKKKELVMNKEEAQLIYGTIRDAGTRLYFYNMCIHKHIMIYKTVEATEEMSNKAKKKKKKQTRKEKERQWLATHLARAEKSREEAKARERKKWERLHKECESLRKHYSVDSSSTYSKGLVPEEAYQQSETTLTHSETSIVAQFKGKRISHNITCSICKRSYSHGYEYPRDIVVCKFCRQKYCDESQVAHPLIIATAVATNRRRH